MLAEILKQARKQAGITQDEAHRATGISPDRLTRIERGTGRITLQELESLIEAIESKLVIISKEQQEFLKQMFEAS